MDAYENRNFRYKRLRGKCFLPPDQINQIAKNYCRGANLNLNLTVVDDQANEEDCCNQLYKPRRCCDCGEVEKDCTGLTQKKTKFRSSGPKKISYHDDPYTCESEEISNNTNCKCRRCCCCCKAEICPRCKLKIDKCSCPQIDDILLCNDCVCKHIISNFNNQKCCPCGKQHNDAFGIIDNLNSKNNCDLSSVIQNYSTPQASKNTQEPNSAAVSQPSNFMACACPSFQQPPQCRNVCIPIPQTNCCCPPNNIRFCCKCDKIKSCDCDNKTMRCKCEEAPLKCCKCGDEPLRSCKCEEKSFKSCKCEETQVKSCKCEEKPFKSCRCGEESLKSCKCQETPIKGCRCEDNLFKNCACETRPFYNNPSVSEMQSPRKLSRVSNFKTSLIPLKDHDDSVRPRRNSYSVLIQTDNTSRDVSEQMEPVMRNSMVQTKQPINWSTETQTEWCFCDQPGKPTEFIYIPCGVKPTIVSPSKPDFQHGSKRSSIATIPPSREEFQHTKRPSFATIPPPKEDFQHGSKRSSIATIPPSKEDFQHGSKRSSIATIPAQSRTSSSTALRQSKDQSESKVSIVSEKKSKKKPLKRWFGTKKNKKNKEIQKESSELSNHPADHNYQDYNEYHAQAPPQFDNSRSSSQDSKNKNKKKK